MSSDSETDYASWTPEELMRDYNGEIKRGILVRCLEWYTTVEVKEKINANRTDGKIIQHANFYAEVKRSVDSIALRDGHLPTEYRLQWDKRCIANLEARFGADYKIAKMMRRNVDVREDGTGHETKEYWYRFLAAVEIHGVEEMRSAYGMAACTFREELKRAKRIVKRMHEIAEIEAKGETILQTYIPSSTLQPGQQIYAFVSETSTVLPRNRPSRAKANFKAKPMTTGKSPAATTLKGTTFKATTLKKPTPLDTPTRRPFLSPHMKQTLSFLRNQLLDNPSDLPSLDTLATRFDHPLFCADQTLQERAKFESCETGLTIENWETRCDETGDAIVEQHGKTRVATSLALCIRLWQEQVWCEEEAGADFPSESFLTYTAGRLEDLDGIDEEVEGGLRRYDEDAAAAQMAQKIEMSCL